MRPDRRARLRVPLVAVALALTWLSPSATDAGAQERSSDRPRSELEQEIRDRFAEMVRKRLGLDAAQERAVAAAVEAFQPQRRAVWRRKGDLRRRVRALEPTERRAADVDPSEARAVLAEMVDIRAEELRLFRSEQEALLRLLSPAQVLQFHELREELGDRIRRVRRNGGDEPHDHGGDAAGVRRR